MEQAYTQDMQEIKLSPTKIITGVATAILIGAIGGVYSFIRVADTNTVLVRANQGDIAEIKAQIVPRTEWEATTGVLLENDRRIESKLDALLLR